MAAPVIDLAGVRVSRGHTPGGHSCQHANLAYAPHERRVYCQDCKRTVEAFDAFMTLVRNFDAMVRRAQAVQREADEARSAHLHLIAAREAESIWRGRRAVTCPHCRGGILPEDVTGGRSGWTRREDELKRREKRPK